MKKIIRGLMALLAIFVLFSCASGNDGNDIASITLRLSSSKTARSILPELVDLSEITKYDVTLTPEDGTEAEEKKIPFDNTSTDLRINDIKIGVYSIKVEAYKDDTLIYQGKKEHVDIKPWGNSTIEIQLGLLSGSEHASGSVEIVLAWDSVSAENTNALAKAINDKSLGFLLVKTESGEAYKDGDDIHWAGEEDLENKSLTYSLDGLKEDNGTLVHFRIYTKQDGKDVVVATLSPSSLQITPGLVSKPDTLEIENGNFTLDDYDGKYINNVKEYNVDATAEGLDVKFTVPKNMGTKSGVITVTLVRGEETPYTQEVSYTSADFGTEKSVSFTGLDENNYKIRFSNNADNGKAYEYTDDREYHKLILISSISLSIEGEDIKAGEKISYTVSVLPDNASNPNKYEITSSDSENTEINVSDKAITFKNPGEYTITVKATDGSEKTGKTSVPVGLAKPENLSVSKSDDSTSVSLSWSPVTGATGYEITRNGSILTTAENNSYNDSSLNLGTEYKYTIKAVNGSYKSEASEAKSITTDDALITIKPPVLENETFVFAIPEDLKTIRAGEENKFSITIEPVEGASEYAWYLDTELITKGEDARTLALTSSNFDGATFGKSEFNITLRITKNGKVYSATNSIIYMANILNPVINLPEGITGDDISYTNGSNVFKFTLSHDSADGNHLSYTWESSDSDVASVGKNGEVTVKKPGEVTIKATIIETGETAEKTVTFAHKNINPAINLPSGEDDENIIVNKSNSYTLSFNEPEYGVSESWESSDSAVASVVDGSVTVHKPGTVKFTLTIEETGEKAERTLTFIPEIKFETRERTFMVLKKTGVDVASGYESITVKANVTAVDGFSAESITYSVESGSATVDQSGKVTPTASGNAVIKATTGGAEATITLHTHDFSIMLSDKNGSNYKDVTGGDGNTNGTFSPTYNMRIDFNCGCEKTGFTAGWGFESEGDYDAGWTNAIKIQDVNSESLTASIKRGANAEKPAVHAYIKYNGTLIATPWFTATNS
ncbi:MAG TPA: Ig-like domain-containing protein [Candidatus Ornithospirochaeta avicola]|uniref:Ig-like domain-containing protein n=1 Tax=Candidatus Ornithospirochaeta avicola TaxID=2840896 RepID=A0A9D1TMV3_9SPIO|nr:Ig-like domain-containing protein [Candidatus Ornithospirochaeta avicola]